MLNLGLVEDQPHWRVAVVACFAAVMGVLIHVEGIPFGSNRRWKKQAGARLGGETSGASGIAGARAEAAQEKA